MITIFVGEGEVCPIDYNLIWEDGAWEDLSGRPKLFCDLWTIPWGDLLRSLPHIKTEVKLNFQANSESNSK